MTDVPLRVPTPRAADHLQNEMWVDEQIWGHRLWDSQSPWILFLEFLSVAEAKHREGALLDERGQFYPLQFRPNKRMALRNLLFNNEAMPQIAAQIADNEAAWSAWLKAMHDTAQAVSPPDFAYLRLHFRLFHQLELVVGLLRSSGVESESNRRWTSRFVFPFGPNALYEDLTVKSSGQPSREYINFGRTGELLYLMLCRASCANELRPFLGQFLAGANPWNTLIGVLQPSDEMDRSLRESSYLPYQHHTAFDRLGEDWLALCRLQLPGFDTYPHFVTLGALHIALYQLAVAADQCGSPRPWFICELVAPRKTLVRELSTTNYLENSQLSRRAVEALIGDIAQSPEWLQAVPQSNGFSLCKAILQDRVRWPREAEDYDGPEEPDRLIAEFRASALNRHRQHTANVHRSYGGGAGLVSRRGTNRLRYAPNDALLKAMVLANVRQRMEFSQFLTALFERYGFVFGEREAERVLGQKDFDKRAFQANAERLERRLATLGMLRRLSDACAYVINPLWSVGRHDR